MAVFEVFEKYNKQFVKFLEAAKQSNIVRSDLDTTMLTGLILDRLGNQIIYAAWTLETNGKNTLTDEAYKRRWLKANLDLFLHGICVHGDPATARPTETASAPPMRDTSE